MDRLLPQGIDHTAQPSRRIQHPLGLTIQGIFDRERLALVIHGDIMSMRVLCASHTYETLCRFVSDASPEDGPILGRLASPSQDAEKVRQQRSRIAQRLNVPKRTPRPFVHCGFAGQPF